MKQLRKYKAQLSITWKKEPKQIEWKKPQLAIEWKKDIKDLPTSRNIPEKMKKAVKKRHYIPIWLKKIKTFSKDPVEEPVPSWIKKIDTAILTTANEVNETLGKPMIASDTQTYIPHWLKKITEITEENGVMPMTSWMKNDVVPMTSWMKNINIDIDNYNKLPEWLGRMNICQNAKKRFILEKTTKYQPMMKRMEKIDIFKDRNFVEIPSWIQHMNVDTESKKCTELIQRRKSWMQWDDVEDLFGLGITDRVSNLNMVKSMQSICKNVLNVAVIVAACDVCSSDSKQQMKDVISNNRAISLRKRKFFNTSVSQINKKSKRDYKTNRKSMERRNKTPQKFVRCQRRAPQNYSRMSGIRAC